MKSEDTIYLDYQRAKKQAAEIAEVSENLKSLAGSDLEGCLTQIAGAWQGENAQAYLKKGRQLEEKIQKLAGKIKDTSVTVNKMAEDTYKAEMRALTLAKQREKLYHK